MTQSDAGSIKGKKPPNPNMPYGAEVGNNLLGFTVFESLRER